MGRTRRLLVPLLLLSACDGGGVERVARPEELQIRIIRGRAMQAQVRDPGASPDDPGLSADPVTVRVSLAASGDGGIGGATATSRRPRLPPVEVRWRTTHPFCQVKHAVTPILHGDTVSNHYLRPTLAEPCQLIAEGVAGGRIFDADTAAVSFAPGRVAHFEVLPANGLFVPRTASIRELMRTPEDAHGNPVSVFTPRGRLSGGGVGLVLTADTLLRATQETTGATLTITVDTVTRQLGLSAIADLSVSRWRISWSCRGLQLSGGAYSDSAHYRLDEARATYGSGGSEGIIVSFSGTLASRVWNRGEPVRETVVPGAVRAALQRPFALEWSPGQTSATLSEGFYLGGTLCDAPPGAAWAHTDPLRVDRLARVGS
jgi:hypothetical protein